MASVRKAFARALAAHREAVAQVRAAEKELADRASDESFLDNSVVEQVRLAERLAASAATAAPGWLGAPFDSSAAELPLGRDVPVREADGPVLVRVGEARPVAERPEARWPALVPLLGAGHLTVDEDTRHPAVAGLLRGVLLRLLAGAPTGSLRVLTADPAAVGATFGPFQPLVEAEAVEPPITDSEGFRGLLDAAEKHVRAVQAARNDGKDTDRFPYLLVVAGSVPDGRAELARLAALAHAGPDARLHLVVAGYPPPDHGGITPVPPLPRAVAVTVSATGSARLADPPGARPWSGGGLAAPVVLDPAPPDELIGHVSRAVAGRLRAAGAITFKDLMPARRWPGSSVTGLRTVVGRHGRDQVDLAFDDSTPHWLVGGRTGSGKTVFLLDVLYGLAARYSPDELALYLLDFKEGVSFTEFTPTAADPSWIPHARAVGVESDREYGVAVLRELSREMSRRSVAMKRAGVTKLADLRNTSDVAMPRILAVIDEFHVLFAGNDRLARQAADLLEELARKGRSYGVHLILSSQTASGVEALYTKSESIFGQFPVRVALAGAAGILDPLNTAADGLPVGTAVINDAGGMPGRNKLVRFPDAHADAGRLAWLRHELWNARTPGSAPPAIFAGYAEQRVEDDPTFAGLRPGTRRRVAVVGRAVDVGSSTAGFPLDEAPGRHVGVLGPTLIGADVLHGAATGLGRQHEPGSARFVIASLVAGADTVADQLEDALLRDGHQPERVDTGKLVGLLGELAGDDHERDPEHSYLVVFGMDAARGALAERDRVTGLTGADHLRTLLRRGPARGVHLLGWWRGLNGLSEDLGGATGREDLACLVVLNVAGSDLGGFLGRFTLEYAPRPNRALLVDRHADRVGLIVPFVRPDLHDDVGGSW
jgi:S-DNA-T family DNA segregation ATPase FtsK/SpoIIIE